MPLIAVHWSIALDVSSAVVGDDQRRLVVLGPGADRATRTSAVRLSCRSSPGRLEPTGSEAASLNLSSGQVKLLN
jgi:hypothetical protein